MPPLLPSRPLPSPLSLLHWPVTSVSADVRHDHSSAADGDRRCVIAIVRCCRCRCSCRRANAGLSSSVLLRRHCRRLCRAVPPHRPPSLHKKAKSENVRCACMCCNDGRADTARAVQPLFPASTFLTSHLCCHQCRFLPRSESVQFATNCLF